MDMSYEAVKARAFAKGSIPDGYFGEREDVEFTFDEESGKILTVSESGYFPALTPVLFEKRVVDVLAIDQDEAFWLLERHPSSRVCDLELIA